MIWNNAQTKRIAKILETMAGKGPNTKYDDAIKRIADALEFALHNGGIGGGGCHCHDRIVQNYYNKDEFDELILNMLRGDPDIMGLTELIVEEGTSVDDIDLMAGVTAYDHDGVDITGDVIVTGTIDPDTPGEYTVSYAVSDRLGKATVETRKVVVEEWKIENYATVLFEDGHFMINENKRNRDADIAVHGAVTNEYAPWDKKNPETSYVFYSGMQRPWNSKRTNIKSASAGSLFKPKITSYMFSSCPNLATLDVSNWDTSTLTNTGSMFSGCSNLTTLDVSNWDTSALTVANDMFRNCSKLALLDVSNWDTSALTNASYMFYFCTSLITLDVSNWDTGALAVANNMFQDCTNLAILDVSNWDTSVLTGASEMFRNCSSLTTLDVSSWDTSALENAMRTFYGCSNLTTIYASSAFVVSQIISGGNMFYDCTSLVGGAGTTYNSSYKDKTYARIDNPPSAPGYFTEKPYTVGKTYRYRNNSNATIIINEKEEDHEANVALYGNPIKEWDATSAENNWAHPWTEDTNVKKIVIGSRIKPTSINEWFYGLENLETIENAGLIDTSECTSMEVSFYYCKKLVSADLSSWDTSNVTTMRSLFHSANLFADAIEYLNRWNTSNVEDMSGVLCGNWAIVDLQILFDMSNVKYARSSFAYMNNVETIDISGIDLSKLEDAPFMFGVNDKLRTIYASHGFALPSGCNSVNMFSMDKLLVGGAGTTYGVTTGEWARIDNPPTYPGYFTAKP